MRPTITGLLADLARSTRDAAIEKLGGETPTTVARILEICNRDLAKLTEERDALRAECRDLREAARDALGKADAVAAQVAELKAHAASPAVDRKLLDTIASILDCHDFPVTAAELRAAMAQGGK